MIYNTAVGSKISIPAACYRSEEKLILVLWMQIFRTFKKMLNCGPVIKSFGSLSLSPVIG